jgi:16S rRNA (guanine527-N7)-methyltransferase
VNQTLFRDRLRQRAGDLEIGLPAPVVPLLEQYFLLLSHWNKKINLTGLSLEPLGDDGLHRLFIEPLVAARYVADSPIAWFDVGSGGGSPAIPLKVLRPAARLTMVESRSRKASFLREAIAQLRLREATVIEERFETVAERSHVRKSASLITIRGVRVDQKLGEACHDVLEPDGRLLLFGRSSDTQVSGFHQESMTPLGREDSLLGILRPI